MACGGMSFTKNQILEKKIFISFFLTFNFLMILLLHKNLKDSRNIQGLALIRVVLLVFIVNLVKPLVRPKNSCLSELGGG